MLYALPSAMHLAYGLWLRSRRSVTRINKHAFRLDVVTCMAWMQLDGLAVLGGTFRKARPKPIPPLTPGCPWAMSQAIYLSTSYKLPMPSFPISFRDTSSPFFILPIFPSTPSHPSHNGSHSSTDLPDHEQRLVRSSSPRLATVLTAASSNSHGSSSRSSDRARTGESNLRLIRTCCWSAFC